MLSSFPHRHVAPNQNDFLSNVERAFPYSKRVTSLCLTYSKYDFCASCQGNEISQIVVTLKGTQYMSDIM